MDLLILSHGQASVERGFSVDKEVVENLQEHFYMFYMFAKCAIEFVITAKKGAIVSLQYVEM